MKVTKHDLVRLIQAELKEQKEVKATVKDVELHLNAFLEVFADQTSLGNTIAIPGAFTVKATEKEERVCTSPSTGEEVVVAAHTGMKLVLAKHLRKVM